MRKLKIAVSEGVRDILHLDREIVDFDHADLTEVAVAVLSARDVVNGKLDAVEATCFGIPVIAVDEIGRAHV